MANLLAAQPGLVFAHPLFARAQGSFFQTRNAAFLQLNLRLPHGDPGATQTPPSTIGQLWPRPA